MDPTLPVSNLAIKLINHPDSQYVIAAKCHIDPRVLSRYKLSGFIPGRHMIRLCEFFGCQPEDIEGFPSTSSDTTVASTANNNPDPAT